MEKIDLTKILRAKNPKLARYTPRFVVRSIESLLMLKRHNEILERYSHLSPIGFIDGALDYIGVRYELYGVENLPEHSKMLFAANHPLGGVDGMILATAIERYRPGVRLIVNDILLNLEPLRGVFVGVNKHGAQRSELHSELDDLYNSDHPIINFAAGLCSRKIKGKIVDPPWRSNFVVRSQRSERVIVPTYVEARNSKFFYFFANLRKWLGIKSNLEMMLLPRQVFFQRGKTVKIYFGDAISLDQTMNSKQWCEHIRQRVYKLKERV